MKEKRDEQKKRKNTGQSDLGEKEEDTLRNKEDSEHEEKAKMERHWSNRLSKRGYHPDGPGGSYDGL